VRQPQRPLPTYKNITLPPSPGIEQWAEGVAGGGDLPANYNKFHGLSEAVFTDPRKDELSPGGRYPRIARRKTHFKCKFGVRTTEQKSICNI